MEAFSTLHWKAYCKYLIPSSSLRLVLTTYTLVYLYKLLIYRRYNIIMTRAQHLGFQSRVHPLVYIPLFVVIVDVSICGWPMTYTSKAGPTSGLLKAYTFLGLGVDVGTHLWVHPKGGLKLQWGPQNMFAIVKIYPFATHGVGVNMAYSRYILDVKIFLGVLDLCTNRTLHAHSASLWIQFGYGNTMSTPS